MIMENTHNVLVGYDFDDIDGDENDNVLDQEAMTSFIQQLFTLQKKIYKKNVKAD